MEKTQVQVRIPNDLLEKIDQKGYDEVRSRSNVIIWILTEFFDVKWKEDEQ